MLIVCIIIRAKLSFDKFIFNLTKFFINILNGLSFLYELKNISGYIFFGSSSLI